MNILTSPQILGMLVVRAKGAGGIKGDVGLASEHWLIMHHASLTELLT